MRSFRFRLESVLTLRVRDEDLAKRAYADSVVYRNRCQDLLDQSIVELQKLQEELFLKRGSPSSRDEQLTYIHGIKQQRDFCLTVSQRLARSEQLVKARMDEWLACRRKTQMLDKIKLKQSMAYCDALRRYEERAIDDFVASSHGRVSTLFQE